MTTTITNHHGKYLEAIKIVLYIISAIAGIAALFVIWGL